MSAYTLPCMFWGAYTLMTGLSTPAHGSTSRARAAMLPMCIGGIGWFALWSGNLNLFMGIEGVIFVVQLLAAFLSVFVSPPKAGEIVLETWLIGAANRLLVVGLIACLTLA